MKKQFLKLSALFIIALVVLSTHVYAEGRQIVEETTTVKSTKKSSNEVMPERMFPICIITGYVTSLESLEKSAWQGSVPSSFSSIETQIGVALQTRSPRDPNARADAVCTLTKANVNRLYKFCSPTPIRVGDMIQGIEGTDTGVEGLLGCLFDVAVKRAPVKTNPPPTKQKQE